MKTSTDDFLRQTYGRRGETDDPPPSPHAVIRASAGAGKTYQLTTRYLRLLRAGAAAPTILATTFTRKAAGEILQRVLGRLARACESEAERQSLEQDLGGYPLSTADCLVMLRRVTGTLHKLSIGTIDGFFNRAAGALRFELGLPADPRLTDEGSPLSRQLRLDAIQAVLGDMAATDDGFQTLVELLRRLHHDTAQRRVTDAIDDVAVSLYETYRQYPEQQRWGNVDFANPLTREQVKLLADSLEQVKDALPRTKAGQPSKPWVARHSELLDALHLNAHDQILGNGLIKAMPPDGPGTYYRAEIPDELADVLRPIKLHASAVAIHELLDQTRATYDLLNRFHTHYERLRREQRVLLFSDLTHLLARYQPEDNAAFLSELYYRLDAQVTHLLLDEFQDTSLDQWKVISGFAEEVAAVGDGQRSLFCVGDVKQAIYGWRGGCAEVFAEIEQLPGIEQRSLLSLSKSWRSSQVVLDAVNQVFSSLAANPALEKTMPAAEKWQGFFERHESAKDLPGHVVLQTTQVAISGSDHTESNGGDEEDGDDAAIEKMGSDPHWQYVANYIAQLHQASPGRSIGVLLRRRKSARPLLHVLRQLGIDVSEEGGNPIDNSPAVAAVLSAIRLADHPADQAAVFHVVNSPLSDVVGLKSMQAAEVAKVAATIRRQLLDRGYSEVIAAWTRGVAASCDARSLHRLTQLVDLAETFETDATLRPGEFVDAARAAKVEDPSAAPLRVMTIHAAKGLEFDAVVLPELDQNLSGSDSRDLLLIDRQSPIDEPDNIIRRPKKELASIIPQLQEAMDRQAAEKRGEDLCLLYVAMTRAKHALHLLVPPRKMNKNGKLSATGLTNLTYASILRQAFGVDDEPADGDACLYQAGDAAWARDIHDSDVAAESSAVAANPPVIKLVKPGSFAPARSFAETSPSQLHAGGKVRAADLLGLTETGGRRFGTAMHALYETIAFLDEQPPPDDAELQRVLLHAGVTSNVDTVLARFRRQLDQPEIQAVLRREGAESLWRERPFLVPVGDRLLRGTFDRVHIWRAEDGSPTRARLIDYKTDRVPDAGAIADKVAQYRGQIDAYRQAVSTLLGLDADSISSALVFVGDGRVVEIEAQTDQ